MSRAAHTVEVAFASNPLDAAPAWTAVTDYVKSVSSQRGRQFELDRIEAGVARLRLEDTDRRFDPVNTAGPYYPNVRPMKRVRVRATHDSNTYDVFHGFIEAWPQAWEDEGDPKRTFVDITASDAFKLLANIDLPDSVFDHVVRSLGADHWWRLGETDGVNAADAIGEADGTYEGNVSRGVDGPVFAGDGAIGLDGANGRVLLPAGGAPTTFPFTMFFRFKITGAPTGERFMWHQLGSIGFVFVTYEAAGARMRFQVADDNAVLNIAGTTGVVPTDGLAHSLMLVARSSGQLTVYYDGVDRTSQTVGPTAQAMPPTAPIGVGSYSHSVTGGVWIGTIDDPVIFDGVALTATDAVNLHNAATTPWRGDKAGARIGRILDLIGWPAGDRTLDVGISDLRETALGGTALEAIQAAAADDQGVVFVGRDGKIVFQDRHFRAVDRNTSAATFGDTGAELSYVDLTTSFDDARIANRVEVTREGGVTWISEDAASQATYGKRSLQRTLGILSDSETRDAAAYLLSRYKEAALRFEEMGVEPLTDDALWAAVLAREISDRITVKRRPPGGGAPIDQNVFIESIADEIADIGWTRTFQLSPAEADEFWVLGSTTFSVLGSTTRLGY